jgi:hypothetical protein
MKIIILIGAGVVLLALGLFWLSRLGTNTTEQVIAEISDGPDRLTLKAVYSSSWGNSYAARVLFFNDELVDFRGSLLQRPNEGTKFFPIDAIKLRVDILDSSNAEMLKKWESSYKLSTYLEGSVPYDLLKKHYPDLENGSTWTIWVNPKDFSEKEYQRIVAMLRPHAKSLFTQHMQFERNDTNHPNNWLKYPGLLIWRTVYHDYASLKSVVFERKNGKTEETVTITPYGAVEYRQKSERYKFGYGCGLGRLNENADTLFIDKMWETNDVNFPVGEFAQFKDAQGRALTAVYEVVMSNE